MRKRVISSVIIVIVLLSVAVNFVIGDDGAGALEGAVGQRIGVITVEGTIVGSENDVGVFGSGTAAGTLMEQINAAREDESIKAVILRINSPGGSAPASQEIAREVQKLRNAGKIVVTSMGDVAASGAYWIAAGTDRIVANPATMTGSIGVIMPLQNYAELYDKIGIEDDPIKSSPHKDIGSTARKMTPQERIILQGMVDDIYTQFIDVVAEGRNLPAAKVRKLAEQSVYTGRQALKVGLIDELGNYYDAIEVAKRLAKIKGDIEIVNFSEASPWEILLNSGTSLQGLLHKQLKTSLNAGYPLVWLYSYELGGGY